MVETGLEVSRFSLLRFRPEHGLDGKPVWSLLLSARDLFLPLTCVCASKQKQQFVIVIIIRHGVL